MWILSSPRLPCRKGHMLASWAAVLAEPYLPGSSPGARYRKEKVVLDLAPASPALPVSAIWPIPSLSREGSSLRSRDESQTLHNKTVTVCHTFGVAYHTAIDNWNFIMSQADSSLPPLFPFLYFCLSVNDIIGHPTGQKLSCSTSN